MSTEFGTLIYTRRHQLGLNQTEAAQAVGRTQQVWSRWEAGVMMPPLHVLPDIAKFLGMDLGELTELAAKSSVKVKERGPVSTRKNRIEQLEQELAELKSMLYAQQDEQNKAKKASARRKAGGR